MKLIRYFFVGGAAAIVDIGLFLVLAKVVGWTWFFAAAASFVVATLVNYWLSVRHVFESGIRFRRHHELALVFLVSALGLVINQCMLFVMIEKLGGALLVSKLAATGVVFGWNYAARRHFVFDAAGRAGGAVGGVADTSLTGRAP